MKRTISLIIIAVSVISSALSATVDTRQWSDGPLKWTDFKKLLPAGEPSQLEVELDATPLEVKNTSSGRVQLVARAIMRCQASGTTQEQSTPQRLAYHQLQFDMLELMRRHLQEDINSGITGGEVEKRVTYYQDLYRKRIRQMSSETKQGTDFTAMEQWQASVDEQLAAIGVPAVPQVTSKVFSYGVYAGVGYDMPIGSLHHNFGNSATFHVGLTGSYKEFRLKTDLSYSQPSYRNPNIFNVAPNEEGLPLQGNNNSSATHLMFTAQVGYTVYNHGRLSITPNVGCFYNRYSWDVANYSWSKDDDGNDMRKITSVEHRNLHSMSVIASVDFDINISSRVSNTSITGYGHRERWSSSLRITPYVGHSKFNKCDPGVKGVHAGINISYLGLARLLNL